MRYLRVVFAILILWAGVAAALLEPDWVTYTVLGTGGAVLLLTLLLEARIRQSDARQVLTGGIGLVLGLTLAALVLLIASGMPLIAAYVGGGARIATFATSLFVLVCGYLGAVVGRAVTHDLTIFRQPDADGGRGTRFLVGEKSLIDGRIVRDAMPGCIK